MTKILVLYYSSYGHIEKMAYAAAEGVKSAKAEAVVKRVPELVPEDVARKSGYKLDQPAPIAVIDELSSYDGVMFGTGTRFGNMTAQMKNFLDQAGGLWMSDGLVGKVGSVFTSSATQHGGQEFDHPDLSSGPASSRLRHCRPPLLFQKPDGGRRGHGKFALWCLDHRWRRWQPPALRGRARGRALPRPARRRHRREASLRTVVNAS